MAVLEPVGETGRRLGYRVRRRHTDEVEAKRRRALGERALEGLAG
jgi:hypothetical protein